jgi:hypothetical protein
MIEKLHKSRRMQNAKQTIRLISFPNAGSCAFFLLFACLPDADRVLRLPPCVLLFVFLVFVRLLFPADDDPRLFPCPERVFPDAI